MKAWQIFVPVALVMTTAFALEKRSRDAELAQLRGDLVRLKTQTSALAGVPARAEGIPGQPSPAKAETPAEVRRRYEGIFAEESPDAAWSDSAARLARDRLKVALPEGSEVTAVQCKTSFCRIETTHPDRAHFTRFVDASFKDPTTSIWNGATFSSLEGDPAATPWRVVSYLAREGRELPAVAAD